MRAFAVAAALAPTLAALAGCGGSSTPGPAPERRDPCADRNPLRNLYFGDLHVHTAYSFDAYVFEVRTTPLEAYRFARGEPVALAPLGADGRGTRTLRIDRPLDFAAVTDHSEFLGEVEVCTTPGAPGFDSTGCRTYRAGTNRAVVDFATRLTAPQPERDRTLCGDDGARCRIPAGEAWRRIQEAAEAAYDRSDRCSFTSFVAYEYTAVTGFSTLHRNVIFRGDRVPPPITYFEQPTPQGLWAELRAACIDAGIGCDVLAIPHNPNESNGNMFFVEYPGATTPAAERAQAAARAAIEPLVEVYQHKGDSECMNGLAGIAGAPDEQCGFEKGLRDPIEDCGDRRGAGGASRRGCFSSRDFVRGALLTGLAEEERVGANPFRLGLIASTDTHNGTPGAVAEDRFAGHRGTDDDTPDKQLGPGLLTPGGIEFSPGGLAAVWAEENSRGALFDALRRREVYATSGPRIAVRFFGGWDLPPDLCAVPDLVGRAYAAGVPMGGQLPARPAAATAPRFVVSALRDPGPVERPGAPLERIQIVKGWIDGADTHQRVYQVAGAPGGGGTVDERTCQTTGSGAPSLCAVWTDPDFRPEQRAFYYARVLENPTCRWSTFACNALPPGAPRPASCDDPATARTIQERAWTSPIWYQPVR